MALLLIWYIWIVFYTSASVTYGSPVGTEAAVYLVKQVVIQRNFSRFVFHDESLR